jgi:hypothetical protein
VSRSSAEAWIAYGREVIAQLDRAAVPTVSSAALARFSMLLAEWEGVLVREGDFHWETEQGADEVEFLMKALFEVGLAVEREHEAGRMRLRPEEADQFHVTMVRQILAEVEQEGPAFAHFVQNLRNEWNIASEE